MNERLNLKHLSTSANTNTLYNEVSQNTDQSCAVFTNPMPMNFTVPGQNTGRRYNPDRSSTRVASVTYRDDQPSSTRQTIPPAHNTSPISLYQYLKSPITTNTMALRTLGAKAAAALDQELMSTGAFSIDQLMELAGLSVSQALFRLQPPSKGNRILIAVGPGNNGGDGLVAARHLWHYGYKPTVYYPKQPKNELYQVRDL